MKNKLMFLIIIDILASIFSLITSFLLRFDFSIPEEFYRILIIWVPLFAFSNCLIFSFSGLYVRIWKYTSLYDLYAILRSSFIAFSFSLLFTLLFLGAYGFPRSVLFMYFIINTISVIAVRLSVRIYFSHYQQNIKIVQNSIAKKLLLIGAGKAAEKITREILTTSYKYKYQVIGFVDDDPSKIGALLHGIRVLCNINDLPKLSIDYDEILIITPSATGDQMRRIINLCKTTGKKYKTVPALNEIIDNTLSVAAIRDVSYSDLLGRDEVKLDMKLIEDMLYGKRILITGAGGSIGEELLMQCLKFKPAELICLEPVEEKIYHLDNLSKKSVGTTIIKTFLGSVNNKADLNKVFLDNRPQIVFHAAAYKHVPIQELHPWQAIRTNIGGTKNLVELCDKFEVEKFVLVSTDKAVNPVNVMGASKRAAEKLILSYNSISKTCFLAVRFGNVLGSSGSAIPTFQEQINKGGPVTITHPEMTRYFMSIQEASQLILQSAALGNNGEIFLLEMGNPIKILQMAKDLITLSGFRPEVDIPIVFSGLRPGEKLYEELQSREETKLPTTHEKILILKDTSYSKGTFSFFSKTFDLLLEAAEKLDQDLIQLYLKELLPSYRPNTFNTSLKNDKTSPYPSSTIKGQA